MTDDLLRALGRHQREDLDAEPERPEPDPFDARERAEILDAVFEQVEEQPPAKVVPLAPRRRVWIASVLATAAAAGLLWWLLPTRGPDRGPLATVPAYAFGQLDGGLARKRAEPEDPRSAEIPELELEADGTIEWVLTPSEPTRRPIGVALLARSEQTDELVFVPRLAAEVSPSGAIRLSGPLREHVELGPGTWTLTLLVAEPEQLPADARAAASDEPAPWRSLALRVMIVADSPGH